jgi:ribosomal protein L37AE/L43A
MFRKFYCPNCEKERSFKHIVGGDWKCKWCGFGLWIEEKLK